MTLTSPIWPFDYPTIQSWILELGKVSQQFAFYPDIRYKKHCKVVSSKTNTHQPHLHQLRNVFSRWCKSKPQLSLSPLRLCLSWLPCPFSWSCLVVIHPRSPRLQACPDSRPCTTSGICTSICLKGCIKENWILICSQPPSFYATLTSPTLINRVFFFSCFQWNNF